MEYFNYTTRAYEAECAEQEPGGHRWYIKLGFAGFNSHRNNRNGYASKARAEAACRWYAKRGTYAYTTTGN